MLAMGVNEGKADFYPRPPRGGRLLEEILSRAPDDFYPRPPRGGRPVPWLLSIGRCMNFYPRPPRGGRRDGENERNYL